MPQEDRVMAYMKNHRSITSLDAFNHLGITRLAARIYTLRRLGHEIITTKVKGINRFSEGTTYAKYVLVKTNRESNND